MDRTLAIFTFFLPLGQIHTKMLREREKYEDNHAASIGALREQIHVLLNDNQLDTAKTVQEKMKLTETLFIPYPTWPFNVKMESLTAFFGAGIASFLLGVITALGPIILQALQQHK